MTLIALGGDRATTTAVALAAGWPAHSNGEAGPRDVVVIEADPTGGSLAAWLDTPLSPSLSSIVTALRQSDVAGTDDASRWRSVDAMIRRSSSGIRFVPAPFRAREARGAVGEADQSLLPLVAEHPVIGLLDVGAITAIDVPTMLGHSELTVLTHAQEPASAAAATVRLERLAETATAVRDAGHRIGLVIIGDQPFPLSEIVDFVAPDTPAWSLPVDPLSAQVLAGRSGVSARRFARLPLARAAAQVARDLDRLASRRPIDAFDGDASHGGTRR